MDEEEKGEDSSWKVIRLLVAWIRFSVLFYGSCDTVVVCLFTFIVAYCVVYIGDECHG
jgi:hypothetical protein